MALSKSKYIRLASDIKIDLKHAEDEYKLPVKVFINDTLIPFLQFDNPRFNKETFLKACGLD